MKQWTREIEINRPIEHVWSYLNGSLEQMHKIMPQVVENKPIKLTDEVVGSVYRQKYKEGKRIEEYDVHTLEYVNHPNDKKLKIGFTLANMFEITARYELRRVNDQKTVLTYTATNKALKWFVKLFMIFATEKVVVKFLETVKKVAESEYQQD
ncbi:SRPBCC family protein [Paenibacillus endoradicis]|uniref:SRPBCC family protein n=1 Tax=Paenibacillus endoradicis TaxID=2972487 RepID=UPI002158BE5F|nr:SRPBCC family protein [Paenibacillus endoradicis]MCR8658672.1 SRPBCC family protein [Paenibacillus endoradicis]